MADSAGTYSETANNARVAAGLKGNPGLLQDGNPAPKLTFKEGNTAEGQRAAQRDMPDERMKIVDPWRNRKS